MPEKLRDDPRIFIVPRQGLDRKRAVYRRLIE